MFCLVLFLLAILLLIFTFCYQKDNYNTLNSAYISLASNYGSDLYKGESPELIREIAPSGVVGAGSFSKELL